MCDIQVRYFLFWGLYFVEIFPPPPPPVIFDLLIKIFLLLLLNQNVYFSGKMELPFEKLDKDLLIIQRFKLNKYIQENIDYLINLTSSLQTLFIL